MKFQDVTIKLQTDGLHCWHDNGAKIVIGFDKLVRWIKSQFRASV